jgi:zinc finger SWIM domain-containing protein 3
MTVVAICQHGGEFVTNSDGTLSYSGGDAHAIEVSREMSVDDLRSEINNIFGIDSTDLPIKYFLPNNRRTLISISCDRDLQRMVDFTANAASAEVFLLNKPDG